jgi:hypothetical protein
LGRPVVLLELHDLRVRVVALEIEDVAHVGTTPGVDRLVRIADHAEIPVLTGDLLDELVLHPIRVLVLVDEDVLEATSIVAEYLRESLEDLDGLDQQIAEVERVGVSQQPLVGGVDLDRPLRLEVEGLPTRRRR